MMVSLICQIATTRITWEDSLNEELSISHWPLFLDEYPQ